MVTTEFTSKCHKSDCETSCGSMAGKSLKQVSSSRCFDGYQKLFIHQSHEMKVEKKIFIYLPPRAVNGEPCPVLYWCTGAATKEGDFAIGSGFQRYASEANLIVAAPEPSPKPEEVVDNNRECLSSYYAQFGWYVDATQPPYSENFRTYSYWTKELIPCIDQNFPTIPEKRGIAGHSMGGHGALILGLRNPHLFKSISCMSPVCCASEQTELFTLYFGQDKTLWEKYDAACCTKSYQGPHRTILFDQGLEDEYGCRLKPGMFVESLWNKNLDVIMRFHEGYSHAEGFISTFIGDHINHHAKQLDWTY